LISETFTGIALALVLGFIVLSLVSGNPIMAFYSVFTILLIVLDVFAFTVLAGFKLGVLEAVNYVVVIGLSIDYTVHLSEAYTESHATDRHNRVIGMVEEMGVSVLSGALSTLGAAFFMFFAPNVFFVSGEVFCHVLLNCWSRLTLPTLFYVPLNELLHRSALLPLSL
jgi:predicted RND superfamily exporter protein